MKKAIIEEFDYYFQFMNPPGNLTAIFSNRKLNLGFYNQPNLKIKKNRHLILSKLNLDLGQLVCAQQVHEDGVYVVEQKDKGRGSVSYEDAIANTDALITNERGIALAVFIADCLPIYIFDEKNQIAALVHAGWRSTKKSILKNTIFIMQQSFNTKPSDIIVFFGPAIRRCCYEVGDEFLNHFDKGLYRKENKLYLDLIKINSLESEEAGVKNNQVFDSKICTSCQNDKFFSYRKEGKSCGRQMALMVIR